MSVKRQGAAQTSLEAHTREAWQKAHGIWTVVRSILVVRPSFRAIRATSDQSITTASSDILVQLNGELWDTHAAYDPTTNYRWTCKRTGLYQFNAGARIYNNSGSAADIFVRLRIGGSAGTAFLNFLQENAVPNGGYVVRYGAAQEFFTVDDYVEMYIYTSVQPVTVKAGSAVAGVTGMDSHWVGLKA